MRRRSVTALSRMLLLPLAAGACGASGGCGMTSEIENRSGGVVEARILGGSPGSIYLSSKEHGKLTMRRDDIADVDFPGNMLVLGGVGLTVFGAWRLRVGDTDCAAFGEAGLCLFNVVPAIAGLLVIGWGLYSYVRANRAFEDRSKPEPDPVMKPRQSPHPPGWSKPDPFADPRQ